MSNMYAGGSMPWGGGAMGGGYGFGMPYGYQGGVPNQLAMLQALQGGYGGNVPMGQGVAQMMQLPQFGQQGMQGMPQTQAPPPQYSPQQMLAQQYGQGSRAFYSPFNSPYGPQRGPGPNYQLQPQAQTMPAPSPQPTPMGSMGFGGQPGSVTAAVQAMRNGGNGMAELRQAAGLPSASPLGAPPGYGGGMNPYNPQSWSQPSITRSSSQAQAPAQQRFSPLRSEGYRNGPF